MTAQDQPRLNELRRTAEASPASSSAHSRLGVALLAHGLAGEAQACFERALELDPGNTTARRRLESISWDADHAGNRLRPWRYREGAASDRAGKSPTLLLPPAARIVSPPRAELDRLPTPLTAGERNAFDFFDRLLEPEWEIYVQPHFNGLRPDLVLLNPDRGVGVFEVKDWNLQSGTYFVDERSGVSTLWQKGPGGSIFRPKNPLDQAEQYRQVITSQYACTPMEELAIQGISAGVIFAKAPTAAVEELFRPLIDARGTRDWMSWLPLSGSDDLRYQKLYRVFPKHRASPSAQPSPGAIAALRPFLVEPDFAAAQREPLELDREQQQLTMQRTPSGYRRIRGPAGSGKSTVLAGRAAQLEAEGKSVLVLTFNITMWHYLRDLAMRHRRTLKRSSRAMGSMTFWHFHDWCREVCLAAGLMPEYKTIFSSRHGYSNDMDQELTELVKVAIENTHQRMWDAILVDEGQDLHLQWWQLLRRVVAEGGEMLLVADRSQDLYQRGHQWTEDAMLGSGFAGPWLRLSGSYRMPHELQALVQDFAVRYLDPATTDLAIEAERRPELQLYPCDLRWIQVSDESVEQAMTDEILSLPVDHIGYAWADVVFLTQTRSIGSNVAAALQHHGLVVTHVFHDDSRDEQRSKRGFWAGNATIKGSTVKSFKGWEGRAIYLALTKPPVGTDWNEIYVALTRMKRHPAGSFLTVVSGVAELASFGKQWFEYLEV